MGSTGKPMAFTGLIGIIFRPGSTVSASASQCCLFPSGAADCSRCRGKNSSPRPRLAPTSVLQFPAVRRSSRAPPAAFSLSPTSSSSSFCFHLPSLLLTSSSAFCVGGRQKLPHSLCHVTLLRWSRLQAVEAQTEQSRRPDRITDPVMQCCSSPAARSSPSSA